MITGSTSVWPSITPVNIRVPRSFFWWTVSGPVASVHSSHSIVLYDLGLIFAVLVDCSAVVISHCACRRSSECDHLWSSLSTHGHCGVAAVLCLLKANLWLLLVHQHPGPRPDNRPRGHFPCNKGARRELHLCGKEPCDWHLDAPV